MLDKIIKYGLYSLVFLLPLFFLPWTVFPVALNKQMLLAVFVFSLLILWLVKIINLGKLNFVWNKLTVAVSLFLLVLGVSTAFSAARIQSFWGMAAEADTFFNFILFVLVFFIFANLTKENEEVSKVIFSFLLSSGILSLFFLIQCFKPIFPWDFARTSGFNPIGSVQALAVFLGGAFVILMVVLNNIKLQRLYKISGGIIGVLFFITIFLVNYWAVWLGIAFSLAIIIFRMLKKLSVVTSPAAATNPLKPLLLPLLIFVLALVFVFLKLPVGNIVSLPSEISLTYPATFDIAKKTLEEGPKNLILGSGPATFGYQYSLHRGTGPNLTDFWQVRFDQGADTLLTFLVNFGVLGLLIILLMMAVFFWQGFKNISPAFLGGFYLLISWFLYPINFSLMFAAFLMMGLWQSVSINQPNRHKGTAREFSFTQSPQKAFFIMLVCVILIAGSILGLYNFGQKYTAAIIYAQGLKLINSGESKLDEGIIALNRAVVLDKKDFYFRNLSQTFLLKINQVLFNQELSQEQKQTELQKQVSNAEMSAAAAIQVNPRDSYNWLQLGNVYENLALVNAKGAGELAVTSYRKATELDPQNPQIPFNLARVYFAAKEYDKAKEELQKSIGLKNDFQPAIDLMKQMSTE